MLVFTFFPLVSRVSHASAVSAWLGFRTFTSDAPAAAPPHSPSASLSNTGRLVIAGLTQNHPRFTELADDV